MEINENTQKIINVLRGYGMRTLNVIMTKTSLSEPIVLLELRQLAENYLIKVTILWPGKILAATTKSGQSISSSFLWMDGNMM